MDAGQIWTHVVKRLALQPHNQRSWIDPVRVMGFDGQTLMLNAGSGFGAYWLEKHYRKGIDEALGQIIPGASVQITHKPLSLRG